MKKLILIIAILFASSAYAGECHRRDNQCDGTRSKTDAYEIVAKAENRPSDTKKVVDIIISIERQTGVHSNELAYMYVTILKAIGGPDNTKEAIKILRDSQRLLRSDHLAKDVGKAAYIIGTAENTSHDSAYAFNVVASTALLAEVSIIEVANTYRIALKSLGGFYNTNEAIEALRAMSRYAHLWHFADMSKSIHSLAMRENSASDAVDNFKLVLNASVYCDNLKQPTDDFLRILKSNGGAMNTRISQSAFRSLYGI